MSDIVINSVPEICAGSCDRPMLWREIERLQRYRDELRANWQTAEGKCIELKAEIERLRAFEDELMNTNRDLRVEIKRLRAEREVL